jgi:polysaccharide deacetylase 2 family uncharacterized protein YibQ
MGSVVILIAVFLFTSVLHIDEQESRPSQQTIPVSVDTLRSILFHVVDHYELTSYLQEKKGRSVPEYHILVPQGVSIPSFQYTLQQSLKPVRAHIINGRMDPLQKRLTLEIGHKDSVLLHICLDRSVTLLRDEKRIALIIDDFGNRWNSIDESFLNLGAEFTVSVLPGLKMSERISQEVRERGFELMLHLPMEPLNAPFRDNGYIILADMTRQQVRQVVQRSLDAVPGVMGMNNHMGSKITSNRQIIQWILEEIKSKDLYFIDSRTTAQTVAYDVARQMGIKAGKRDVFIDVEDGSESIRANLWELARKADTRGYAIGIGHCRKKTLNVLKEEIPKLQAKGYRFVPLSHVVQ